MKKFGMICGWGALAIALLFAIVAALASPIASYIINHRGENILGRELKADRVRVNLFTGGITIHEFHCKELNGQTDFINWENMYVQIAYPKLLVKRVDIGHIHLEEFNGQVLQNRNELNFTDLIERFTSKRDTLADDAKSEWIVELNDIRIENSSVYYRNVINGKQWKLEDISLSVPGLDIGENSSDANGGLEFALPTGGRVGVTARYLSTTNTLAVRLKLYDVHADVVLPLVQDYVNVSGLGAKINGNLQVSAGLDNIQNILIRGTVGMKGLSLKDGHKNEVAGLDELRAVVDRCDLNTNTFILDSLMLYGLTAKYEVHKNWNTFSRLLKSNDNTGKKSSGKSKQIVWQAKNAVLTGHDITYQDYSMKHDWKYAIKTLRVEGKNVSSTGRNSLKMNATLTNNGKVKADFKGGLDVKKQNTRFSVTVDNVNLKDFNAACRNYTGYPIESGMLHVESQMEFTNGHLTGNTKIVIDDAQVGKKEKLTKAPYKTLPVRSTVNMLCDSENRIILNAPVDADATKANFSFKKTFTKSLLKVSFGRMMTTKSKKDKISQEEMNEIQTLIGDEEVKPTETKPKKAEKAQKAEKAEKPKKTEKLSKRDKRRSDRKKKR